MRGKAVCLAHGGASTGPKTAAGWARCAEARTVHGRESRQTREVRAEKLRELRELERYMNGIGPTDLYQFGTQQSVCRSSGIVYLSQHGTLVVNRGYLPGGVGEVGLF
jgi:transcriptional regulator of acetoin/glycerol metabolism